MSVSCFVVEQFLLLLRRLVAVTMVTLFAIVGTAAAGIFGILAGERMLVEDLVLAAANQTWIALHTGDQAMAIALHREPGEGPEASGHRIGIHFCGALEANNS